METSRQSEAVASVPNNNKIRFNIFVKEGVYYENVLLPKRKDNVVIYGEGMEKTVISSNQSRLEFPKSTTEATATFCKFFFFFFFPVLNIQYYSNLLLFVCLVKLFLPTAS